MSPTPWPDVFIVGAAKTGTSSLYQYLIQHPDVARSIVKEPHFFSTDINPEDFSAEFYYQKIPDIDAAIRRGHMIHSSFIRNEADYLKLYAGAQGKLKIDSSVSNLFSHTAAGAIHSKNPDARIIIIIRQPVERAFSHYVMDRRSGYKLSLSFTEAVLSDYQQPKKGWGISHLYAELSVYADAIKRYQDTFPANQIHLIVYDDYRNDVHAVLSSVCHFAGLKPFRFDTKQAHNTAALPSNPLTRWLNKNKALKRSLSRHIPDALRVPLRKLAYRKKNLPALTPDDYKTLMPLFMEDILRTEQRINRSLKHWIKP